MKIQEFRKFRHPIEFIFGNKITVISGINGIGKSSLLALMASTTGTNDKRLNGQQFQPKFMDLFNISTDEEYSKYRLFVEFDEKVGSKTPYYLTKRISFKNDEKSGRGIRLIPRSSAPIDNETRKKPITLTQASEDAGTTSKRVQIPTIYVSLSRLTPLGEAGVKSTNIRKGFKSEYINFFRKCYNSVLEGSIDEGAKPNFITKDTGVNRSKYLALQVKQTTNETLSVGQDNLEAIIAAFTDFYALKDKLGAEYRGGIICIDEIDASLHPSAVIKLWGLMRRLSEDLNLQIIVTSHSLTIIKEISRLQENNDKDYRLVYFKDNENPRLSRSNNYEVLKADMFDEVNTISPKTKVYCEDENTKAVFQLLCKSIKNIVPPKDNSISYIGTIYDSLAVIEILLGKDHLISLPKQDEYFRRVLIVLDGDSKLKKFDPQDALKQTKAEYEKGKKAGKSRANNIVRLPSFYSPEVYIYKIMEEVSENYLDYQDFWNHCDTIAEISNITVQRMKRKFKIGDSGLRYEDIHDSDWMKKALKFAESSDLISYYYSNHNNMQELDDFTEEFSKALEAVRKAKARNIFG